jgi:alpha-tubulin suppressor-like RCC1 family protein
MNRTFLIAITVLAVVLSIPFASDTEAQSCNQPFASAAGNYLAWAWGWNDDGQLGDGTTMDRHEPVQVQNLNNLLTVAAGGYHSLALKNNHTVWAWGSNSNGQLGDGTNMRRLDPVQVLSEVSAIAGGLYHSLAIKRSLVPLNEGTVWAWGWNMFGQLGDKSNNPSSTPVEVAGLKSIIAIAAGNGNHNLALMSGGTLYAWGENFYGQLGDGTTTHRNVPVKVQTLTGQPLTGVTCMAAGSGHSLALMQDGTVQAWGQNNVGQLGDNSTTERHTPVTVMGLSDVTAVAAGVGFSQK